MEQQGKAMRIDPWVNLATQAIHTYVLTGTTLPVPTPMLPEWTAKAGVFVSIKKLGQLRGCIGTFSPTQETLAQEIITNAIKAASEDPRFPAISKAELDKLVLSVDVLSEPEACTEDQLDPARFGVIVENGWRRGLLLPALEGVESVEEQLAIARRKARIAPDEPAHISRFTVERHT